MQSTKLVAVVAVWTWFIRDAKQLKTRPGNHKHKDGVTGRKTPNYIALEQATNGDGGEE